MAQLSGFSSVSAGFGSGFSHAMVSPPRSDPWDFWSFGPMGMDAQRDEMGLIGEGISTHAMQQGVGRHGMGIVVVWMRLIDVVGWNEGRGYHVVGILTTPEG